MIVGQLHYQDKDTKKYHNSIIYPFKDNVEQNDQHKKLHEYLSIYLNNVEHNPIGFFFIGGENDIKEEYNENKIENGRTHGQIQYKKEDGSWIHSDICPAECCSSNVNLKYKVPDNGPFTSYNHFLHSCLDEYLDNMNYHQRGYFYIGNHNYLKLSDG